MRSHDGGVDDRPFFIVVVKLNGERRNQKLPDAGLRPVVETVVDTLPRPKS